MTLSSHNYPKWTNVDGIGCEWQISAPEGFIIVLEFNHFDVSNLLGFVKKFVIVFCNNCVCLHISYLLMVPNIPLSHSMMEFVIKPKK